MRIAIATLAALITLLAGCEIYTEDSPTGTDAGLTCEPTADRNTSCRNICRADVEMCEGSDWTICMEECRNGIAAVAWCPGQRSPTSD